MGLINSQLFLKDGKVICACGEELYECLVKPVGGETVRAEDFRPIGATPKPENHTEVRCWKCNRGWYEPLQRWLTDEEIKDFQWLSDFFVRTKPIQPLE